MKSLLLDQIDYGNSKPVTQEINYGDAKPEAGEIDYKNTNEDIVIDYGNAIPVDKPKVGALDAIEPDFVGPRYQRTPSGTEIIEDTAFPAIQPDIFKAAQGVMAGTPPPATGMTFKPEESMALDVLKRDEKAQKPEAGFYADLPATRLGMQILNAFPEMAKGLLTSPLSPVHITMKPEELKRYREQATKDLAVTGWKGTGNIAQDQQVLETRMRQIAAEEKIPTFKIPPAEKGQTGKKLIDIAGGLGRFMTQLAVLKKIAPKGAPDSVIWEIQNQLTGGVPGQGMVTRKALGGIGRIPTGSLVGKIGKTGAESGLFAGITAATGGNAEDIIVSALVPAAFNSWHFVKQKGYIQDYERQLRSEAQKAYDRRGREGMPEPTNLAHLEIDLRTVGTAVAKAKQRIYSDDAFAPAKEKWETERQNALKMVASGKPDAVKRGKAILDFMATTAPPGESLQMPTTRAGELIETIRGKAKLPAGAVIPGETPKPPTMAFVSTPKQSQVTPITAVTPKIEAPTIAPEARIGVSAQEPQAQGVVNQAQPKPQAVEKPVETVVPVTGQTAETGTVAAEAIPYTEKPVQAFKLGEEVIYDKKAGTHEQVPLTKEQHRKVVLSQKDPAGWIYKGKFYDREQAGLIFAAETGAIPPAGPGAEADKVLSYQDLPKYAQDAIFEDPELENASWIRTTVNIKDVLSKNKRLQGQERSIEPKSVGPIVIDKEGTLIDGFNRLKTAEMAGEKTIEVFQQIAPAPAAEALGKEKEKAKKYAKDLKVELEKQKAETETIRKIAEKWEKKIGKDGMTRQIAQTEALKEIKATTEMAKKTSEALGKGEGEKAEVKAAVVTQGKTETPEQKAPQENRFEKATTAEKETYLKALYQNQADWIEETDKRVFYQEFKLSLTPEEAKDFKPITGILDKRIVHRLAIEMIQTRKAEKKGEALTKAEKDALRAKGYTVADILKMTPQEAQGKLGEEKPPTEPPTGSEAGFIEFPFDMPEPLTLRRGLESMYQHYINRFASIENAVKKAVKLGMKILPGENPGIRAREYLGLSHKVGSILERNTFRITKDGQIEITGEGLKPVLLSFDKTVKPLEGRRKIREKDFETYLFSQRTILDLQRPAYEGTKYNIVSPEQVAAAQADLARLRAKYKDEGIAAFESHAQRLYEFQKRVLHLLVDSGNFSQKQYDKIVGQNRHYIPFDRILEESDAIEQGGVPGTKKGFQKTTAPVRKIKGSELEKQPAIESIIRNTYRIADEAEKNTIRKSLAKLASVLPDEINPIRIKMMPIRVDPREILTVVREFRSKSRQVVDEAKTITTEQGEKANLSGPAAKLEKVVKEALTHRGFSEAEANAFVSQIRKGEKAEGTQSTQITTERIQQTIREIQKILISKEPIETTIFRPSQFAPKGRTLEYFENGKRKYIQLSKNLYEAMTGLSEASSGLFVKVFAKPAHWLRIGATITPEFMVRNPIRDQWTAAMQTSFGFIPFVDSIGAMADVLGKTETYHDWLRSGGAYSGFVELNRPALKKAVEELRGVTARKMLKKLNVIADAQDISQLFEQATRLGVFKAARRRGLSAVEAGFEAREATVDFNVRGSQTKDVTQVIAFLGAGVNGLDKTIRTSIKHPISTAIKGLILITLPSLLLYLRNRDEEDYKELPRWQRDLFWLFKVKGVWIRIPKPFLYGQVFGSMPERFMEYLDTKDPKALKDFKKSVYDSVLPISGDPEAGLLATAIKPLIENAVNWNFFMQRPLVPEGKEDLLPPEQYGQYTTETAKQLGQWINYSPAKIENLIRGWFGGTGTYALEAGDKLVKGIRQSEGIDVASERPKTLSDVPGMKGFVARSPLSSPESLREFYDNLNELEAAYKTYHKNPKPETKVKYPGLMLAPQLRRQADTFSTITKSIDRIAGSNLMDKEKNKQIETLELRRLALAKRMNELVDNARRVAKGLPQQAPAAKAAATPASQGGMTSAEILKLINEQQK